MRNYKFLQVLLIMVLLFVSGCSGSAATVLAPTATTQPAPTATTPPTATLPPTATTPPTALPPTATNIPPTATIAPPGRLPLVTPAKGQVEALDLSGVDSELTMGYILGFVQDGYAYFNPFNVGQFVAGAVLPDKVVRVDVNNFTPSGAKVLDLKTKASAIGGAVTDGKYGYFFGNNGILARLDLQNFSDAGLSWLDVKLVDSRFLTSSGAFSDGQYVYALIGRSDAGSAIARIDPKQFTPTGVKFIDITGVDQSLSLAGGCIEGSYGYFSGFFFTEGAADASKIARLDLKNFTPAGVTVLDLDDADKGIGGVGPSGAGGMFCHEGYLYLAPAQGKMARVDTKNFTAGGVTTVDLAKHDPPFTGCNTGFTDGKYFYCMTMGHTAQGDWKGSGMLARIDLSNFSASGLTWLDLVGFNQNWNNLWEGMADGKYLYLVPDSWTNDDMKNISILRVSLDYAGWAK